MLEAETWEKVQNGKLENRHLVPSSTGLGFRVTVWVRVVANE